MALQNITCRCSARIGLYEDSTGCIKEPKLPAQMSAFGVYLHCSSCNRWNKFNGERVRKIAKKKNLQGKYL